jgi:chromate transporter
VLPVTTNDRPEITPGASAPSLLALGKVLLRLGAVAFGGLGAALALLDRDLVRERGWLRPSDLAEALAYTKPLPGSTVVQAVAFLCWRLRGWRGALIGSAAFVVPAAALMILAAAVSARLPEAAWVRGGLDGVQVAVVGLLAAAMWRLAASEARTVPLRLALVTGFALGLILNAALVVVAVGLAGALTGGREESDG